MVGIAALTLALASLILLGISVRRMDVVPLWIPVLFAMLSILIQVRAW